MRHVVEIGEVLVHWRRERRVGWKGGGGMDVEVTEMGRRWGWMGRRGGEEERKVDTHTHLPKGFSEAVVVEEGRDVEEG